MAQEGHPPVEPVVPFASRGGKAFDPVTAPSIVRLAVRDPDGNVPSSPVFVTFVGVGRKNYGGQLDRDGRIEVIMPSGRYYADFLVIDTRFGPPPDPPAFFLEANEVRDLGVIVLSRQSSFEDTSLEREVASTLEAGQGGSGGMAKIFSLIIKLLLAILQEIRSFRSEMLAR